MAFAGSRLRRSKARLTPLTQGGRNAAPRENLTHLVAFGSIKDSSEAAPQTDKHAGFVRPLELPQPPCRAARDTAPLTQGGRNAAPLENLTHLVAFSPIKDSSVALQSVWNLIGDALDLARWRPLLLLLLPFQCPVRLAPSSAAGLGGKARMFEAMDGRVCAGPSPASSAGHRAGFIRAVRDGGVLLFGYFLLDKQEKVTRCPQGSESLGFGNGYGVGTAGATTQLATYVPSSTQHYTSVVRH